MPREDWRDLEGERLRRLRDRDRDRDDFGQADYSNHYGYDPRSRSGYPLFDDGRSADDRGGREDPYRPEPRAYDDRHPRPYGVGEGRAFDRPRHGDDEREVRRIRRDGPSDRVLWAVIMERLDDERRLDAREVEVEVRDREVTLNGTVRHKADKRRIEDLADIDGVRNVQNNLRVRPSRWTLF